MLEELVNELLDGSGGVSSEALLTSSLEQAITQIKAKGRTIPYLNFIFPPLLMEYTFLGENMKEK